MFNNYQVYFGGIRLAKILSVFFGRRQGEMGEQWVSHGPNWGGPASLLASFSDGNGVDVDGFSDSAILVPGTVLSVEGVFCDGLRFWLGGIGL